jgi:hypothetical protein
MKNQLFSIILLAFSTTLMSQLTATNFICNDCSGTSHELFKELDSGKIIVLVWVMPCGACTGPALTCYNIVKSYQSTNPGKVFLYLTDDLANTSCSSLNSWCTSNGIDQSSFSLRFSNSKIKMTDYGISGMPKIVVLGGKDHKTLYIANNTVNAVTLQKTIDDALLVTSTTKITGSSIPITIDPNPASASTTISCFSEEPQNAMIDLLNETGLILKTIYNGKLISGENTFILNTANYPPGNYFVTIKSSNGIKSKHLTISH